MTARKQRNITPERRIERLQGTLMKLVGNLEIAKALLRDIRNSSDDKS